MYKLSPYLCNVPLYKLKPERNYFMRAEMVYLHCIKNDPIRPPLLR